MDYIRTRIVVVANLAPMYDEKRMYEKMMS